MESVTGFERAFEFVTFLDFRILHVDFCYRIQRHFQFWPCRFCVESGPFSREEDIREMRQNGLPLRQVEMFDQMVIKIYIIPEYIFSYAIFNYRVRFGNRILIRSNAYFVKLVRRKYIA